MNLAAKIIGYQKNHQSQWLTMMPVLFAILAGGLLGWISPHLGNQAGILGDIFIRLAQMTAVPFIFSLTALGIEGVSRNGSLGKVTLQIIIYFAVISVVIVLLGLAIGSITGVGKDFLLPNNLHLAPSTFSVAKEPLWQQCLPTSIIKAFADNNLLGTICIAILFGWCMGRLGSEAEPIRAGLKSLSAVITTMIGVIVRLAPYATFGYVALATASYSSAMFTNMATFVGAVYLGMAVMLLVLFPLIAWWFRCPYWALLSQIGDLVVVCLVTRSSEIVLAPLTKRLQLMGVPEAIAGFVLPLGYVFNLCGAALYESVSVMLIVHIYHLSLNWQEWVSLFFSLLIVTKGLTGIPSAGIIALLTLIKVLHVPSSIVVLLMGVEFLIDMIRTTANMVGNAFAALLIAQWQGQLVQQDSS